MLNIRLRHILSIRPGNIQAFFRRTHGNGLLACSGMLNGFFGEGETRHIAHWRSVKYVDEFNEEGETEGETIIRKRERFSHELTLAYESGQIIELKETKEEKVPNRSAE